MPYNSTLRLFYKGKCMSSNLSAGKEILSYCTKCKLNLAHYIIIMKNAKEAGKVKCKTCGSTHTHKDPSQVKVTKSTGSKKTGSGTKRTSLPIAEV